MLSYGLWLIFLLIPYLLIRLNDRVALIRWLSPAFWCYVIGITIGIFSSIDHDFIAPLQSGTVALAIPLMLFSANLASWIRLARPTLISLGLWIGCVSLMSGLAFLLWGSYLPEAQAIGAMASSVYTGGTANMAAVHSAIGAPDQLFNEMNPSDLIVGGSYLIFVLTIVPNLFRWWLPPFQASPSTLREDTEEQDEPLLSIKDLLVSLIWGILALAIPAALSILIFDGLEETFLLVGLTLIGLIFSLIPRIQQQNGTYELGEYFFLVFCLVMGTQIDLEALMGRAPILVGFMATVALGSVLVHTMLGKLFKLDADTVLITQVSGIYGPPFIGPVATRLQNREIIVSGLTLSVIHLAVGNFIGLLMYELLG